MCDSSKYFVNDEEKKRFRNILKQMDLIRNYSMKKSGEVSTLVQEFDEAFSEKKTVMLPRTGWAIVNNYSGEIVENCIEHSLSFSHKYASTELQKEYKRYLGKGISCRIEKVIIKQYND